MAPLAGLAATPQGRALIRNAITENKNAQGAVVSYTVRLHEVHSYFFFKTFTERTFQFPPDLVQNGARPRQDGGPQEIWPAIVEKAYALLVGEKKLGNKGLPVDAMEVLTGREAHRFDIGREYREPELVRDVGAGKLVVLGTPAELGSSGHTLMPAHAYLVTAVEDRGGTPCIVLHDPRTTAAPGGVRDPDAIPLADLGRWFRQVHVLDGPWGEVER
jgi:hypothetical protein